MRIYKAGGHRLFERDPDTARVVSEMLLDLEQHGMDAVRKYSQKFDDWDPRNFELSASEIDDAVHKLDPQIIADTAFCQNNVRCFAQAQFEHFLNDRDVIQPDHYILFNIFVCCH